MPSVSVRTLTVVTLAALAACGDNLGGGDPDGTAPDATDPDASTIDASTTDAPVDGPPDIGTVQCPTPVPAAQDGACDVTAGSGAAVLVQGNVLVHTGVYLDGAVLYQGDHVVCVGCDCGSAPEAATATVVSCGGAVVSAGLINAHDHLNYNNQHPLPSTQAGGTRYNHRHDWRGGVPTPANQHGTGATSNGMRWNELRQIMAGTTSIAASTRANAGLRNLDEPEARDTALGFPRTEYQVFALGDSNETFRPDCTWNYVYSEFQMSLFAGVVTHTAEGINAYAHEEFRCQSTSFMGGRDYTERNVGHIHGVGLKAVDYFNMARDQSKLVWSPRSNISLYGNTAMAPLFHRLGGTIALGTDWTYSGSATMIREMACVAELNPAALGGYFSDEDIWLMATRHAAQATGTAALIGDLKPGMIADVAVFAAAPGQLHRAVIDATTDDVVLVVRDGDVLFGEADVVAALGGTTQCELLDVCGQERRLCAQREFGVTYASIAAAVSGGTNPAYPAVFCAAPPQEPTCLPTRPGAAGYGGPTAGDADGDGIPDVSDNCPTTFNPIRPIDGGVQPDDDDDGIGDACDPTPLRVDLDDDTHANLADNCPFDANTSQLDADMDGKGDVCDACPSRPNPAGVCTPTVVTIVEIQDGTVPAGAAVTVEGAVVTAIDASGFMAQDPTVTSGQYAGVYVFMGSAPGVALGDRVAFAGTTEEYFMMTEVTGALVLSRTAGAPLAPIPLTVAQAATEPYEGVLVTLTDVTKVDYPYSCAADNAACMDARLFELNDTIIAWDRFYQDGQASWTSEATAAAADMTPTVTGAMFYRFDRRRIVPRTAADITP